MNIGHTEIMTKSRESFAPLKGFWPQFFYVLWLPAFFIGFIVIIRPEYFCEYLRSGMDYSFNISIISAIILGVLTLSRLLQIPVRKTLDTRLGYIVCCIFECIAIIGFASLYMALVDSQSISYFDTLYKMAGHLLPVLIIGYAISTLAALAHFYKYASEQPEDKDKRLKFYDSNHLLKMTVAAASILYIEADENYINVCYDENDSLKQKTLRSSMKTVEQMCSSCGIVRCHRSFFVNTAHVKVLRKDKEGVIYIELDHKDAKHIPVSKRHYDSLAEML